MRKFRLILGLIMLFQFGMVYGKTDSIHSTKQQTAKKQTKEHSLEGKATYYGNKYKSTRRTANGDKFDKNAYTAAHKTLPFGTVVRVTNTNNEKSATVRINDRGPFGPGRVIDVTPVVARELGMIKSGVVPCIIEIISIPERKK